jgi:hypothetical protein
MRFLSKFQMYWLSPQSHLKIGRAPALPMLLLFSSGLPLLGCARHPLVSINLMNRTGGACEKAEIELNGKSYLLSASVPNGNASISGGWPYPMPASAKLRWKAENKMEYSATVDIRSPSHERARLLEYEVVILPEGRSNAAVRGWVEPTGVDAARRVTLRDELGRDGGPNYRVAVKNTAGVDVSDLDVRFGPYAVNAGTHLSGSGHDYSIATGLPYPITNSASVRWFTKDGHAWKRVVDLPRVPASDLNDSCFWFVLSREGDVAVRIVNWNALRAGKHLELCRGF